MTYMEDKVVAVSWRLGIDSNTDFTVILKPQTPDLNSTIQ